MSTESRRVLSSDSPIPSSCNFVHSGRDGAPRSSATRRKLLAGAILLLSFFVSSFAHGTEILFAAENQNAGSLDFANGLYARKMYGPAISEYQKFIRENPAAPDTASAYFRLADSHYFLKEYAKAVQTFEVFLEKFPKEERAPMALLRMGTARYFLKNYPGARHALSEVAETKADDNVRAGALFYLAKTSDAEGKPEEAVSVLRTLTEDYPDTDYTMYACLYAGDIFVLQKKEAEAIRVYTLVADGTVRPPDERAAQSGVEEAALKAADLYFSRKKYAEARDFYQKAYDRPGKSSPERSLVGLFYADYYLKDLDAAKKLLFANEAFLGRSPSRYDIDYLLAVLGHEKRDYAFALERLDRILKESEAPEEKKARASAARAYIHAENLREDGKLEEALAGYLEAAKADGDYAAPALYQAGFLSAKLKKNSDARRYLSSYAEKYPAGEEAQRAALQKIQIDIDEEKWDAVVRGAQGFLAAYPKTRYRDVALYKLATGLAGQKNYGEASLTFQRLIADFKHSLLYPEAVYGAAASFDNAGATQQAIRLYETFIHDYPAHALYKDAVPRLGFLYIQARDYEKAAKFYEDILLHQPEITLESSVAFWVIRYDLGRAQYDRMKAILNILSRRYPGEVLTHEINFFLGESLMGLKDYAEALQYYSKSVEAKPDGAYVPYAYLGMGIASEAQDKLDTAENFFVKTLGFESDMAVALRARFEIANLQLKRHHLEEASKAFMHVAILYDDEKYCSAALFKAGECLEKLGTKEEALRVFRELVNRYPRTTWAHRAESLLRKAQVKNG